MPGKKLSKSITVLRPKKAHTSTPRQLKYEEDPEQSGIDINVKHLPYMPELKNSNSNISSWYGKQWQISGENSYSIQMGQ